MQAFFATGSRGQESNGPNWLLSDIPQPCHGKYCS